MRTMRTPRGAEDWTFGVILRGGRGRLVMFIRWDPDRTYETQRASFLGMRLTAGSYLDRGHKPGEVGFYSYVGTHWKIEEESR